MTNSEHQIKIGESVIDYQLSFAARKTLAISVHPDLHISVIAPNGTELSTVEAKLRKRISWILRQQRELALYLPQIPPRQYVSGETHLYLGRQYRLKVIESPQAAEVKLVRGFLRIHVLSKADRSAVHQALDRWYRKQADRVYHERIQAILPRFASLNLPIPTLRIKNLQARWGSCTASGIVTLNLKLIQVPKPFIDYVIVHELCHLIEHNHSKQFYLLLDRTLPDWRERRARLNEFKVS